MTPFHLRGLLDAVDNNDPKALLAWIETAKAESGDSPARMFAGQAACKAAADGRLACMRALAPFSVGSFFGDATGLARTSSTGRTPLMLAAERGHLATLQALLDAPDGPQAAQTPTADGDTALTVAARAGFVDGLLALLPFLGEQEDGNARPDALFHAVSAGRLEAVEVLLAWPGAAFDRPRALFEALREKRLALDMAPLFAQAAPALARAQDAQGRTPLMQAIIRGGATFGWQGVADILLPGSDLSQADEDGRTALHHAAGAISGKETLLALPGSDPNAQDEDGRTPLALALLSGGRTSIVTPLLAVSDLDIADAAGRTPALVAAGTANSLSFQRVMEAGADFSRVDHGGWTALMIAAASSRGCSERLAALAHFCDPRAANSNGDTALDLAIGRNNSPAVQALAPLSDTSRLDAKGRLPFERAVELGFDACADILAFSAPAPALEKAVKKFGPEAAPRAFARLESLALEEAMAPTSRNDRKNSHQNSDSNDASLRRHSAKARSL